MTDALPENPREILSRLMGAARSGDWNSVERLSGELPDAPLTQDAKAIEDYLGRLKEALVVAKAARADLALTANRVAAAVGFHPNE